MFDSELSRGIYVALLIDAIIDLVVHDEKIDVPCAHMVLFLELSFKFKKDRA